jgi:leader peptidase (prepilin peptidase)/N-methyltransferase
LLVVVNDPTVSRSMVELPDSEAEAVEAAARKLSQKQLRLLAVEAPATAAVFAAAALARFGLTATGLTWAAAELLLVFLAAFDIATRRVPNRITLPTAIVVVILRAALAHSALVETLAAGAIAFAVFLVIAVVARGGLGMGDVKLAGLIGLLLGTGALPALFLGVIVGGVASAAVLLTHRGERGRAIAYAPYLCFGGAVAIVAFIVPPLV